MEIRTLRNIIIGTWIGTAILAFPAFYCLDRYILPKSKQIDSNEVSQRNRNLNQTQEQSAYKLSRDEKVATTPWSIVTNKNGLVELITPHRNDYSRTNGPVYVHGGGDVAGETALDLGKWVIEYKKEFAKVAGSDHDYTAQCRVDDINEDGFADRISWPRIERMPVFERPFTKDMHDMADRVIAYDNYIVDYIRRQ